MGMFNVALAHGKAGVTGSCIPFSRRRRWSFGTRRVAMVTIMRVCTVECGCGGIVIRNWGRVIEDDALCGIRFPEGFLVPGQKGNPVRRTRPAMHSGAGTLRLFYVACDHGRCDARGGLWGKAHLYGRLGFYDVALVHMQSDVVRGKGGGGGGEAYLREAGLRRRLWGRGLPIVHLAISTGARRGAA